MFQCANLSKGRLSFSTSRSLRLVQLQGSFFKLKFTPC